MNAFNLIVLWVIALLLGVVPLLLLLVALGGIAPEVLNQYTGYRNGVSALGNLSASSFSTGARIVIAVIGALLALVALLLLLRELTFGRRVARSTVMDDTPGHETVITAGAVKTLAEGAAREVGAESPSASLTSEDQAYSVSCKVKVPPSGNYAELAARTRESIREVLRDQGVPLKDVEVTVQGTAS